MTDRVEIPLAAIAGYYEAKLEIVGGAYIGAVGSIPLIVRQRAAAPASAVLVQVPVNMWEAYNPWGGKSLCQFGTSRHAFEVSFDRPFDQREFHNMGTELELPWVRFLERNGIDVSYQTDVDTDRAPGSLLHHRLVNPLVGSPHASVSGSRQQPESRAGVRPVVSQAADRPAPPASVGRGFADDPVYVTKPSHKGRQ